MGLLTDRGRRFILASFACLLGVCLLYAPSAHADLGSQLVKFGEFGSGAGQIDPVGAQPGGGIEADPITGNLFIADLGNNRISEFTAWGEFVKAWGWGVSDGSPVLQTCTAETGCRQGIAGAAPGQLNAPNGIAMGGDGDLYVFEGESGLGGNSETPNERVQVFTQEGEFVRMFGGDVDKTTGANICTAADVAGGDECGAGAIGTGSGEFSAGTGGTNALMEGDYIAAAPDNTIYVADLGRIQHFQSDGAFIGELSFATLQGENPEFPASRPPGTLTVDPVSGDIYVGFLPLKGSGAGGLTSWRLSPNGLFVPPVPIISSAEGSIPEPLATDALAADAHGHLIAGVEQITESDTPSGFPELWEFSPTGDAVGGCCGGKGEHGESIAAVTTNAVTQAGGIDVYAVRTPFSPSQSPAGETFVEIVGPAPDKWPPPTTPPTIVAGYATAVGEETAKVGAEINPNFWADTRYFVEFGTEPCASGHCQAVPGAPGLLLTSEIVKRSIAAEPIELTDLRSQTTYHYRFVAESGGGGPVVGREATFTTTKPEAAVAPCANDPLRLEAAAKLRDCRAYEMVSPVDKSGGDILVQGNVNGVPARLDQAAPAGEMVTYSSYRSFGDAASARYTSQYLATRGSGGWSSHGISPEMVPPEFLHTPGLDSPFQGFSEDLSSGWLLQNYEPVLAPGATPGQPNLYRADLSSPGFEALTTAAPLETVPSPFFELQGFSADGKRTIFSGVGKYTANAAAGPAQVYESFNGAVRLVSVKPNGLAPVGTATTAGSVNGTQGTIGAGRGTNSARAISEDGSLIYWSEVGGEEKVYLRRNAVKTIAVSQGAAKFWTAATSGNKALYTEKGQLKLFDLASQSSTTLVAEGVEGVMGASDDLSRIYFVSTAALAGSSQPGSLNLYLYESGRPLIFIASLSPRDLSSNGLSPVTLTPYLRVSQITPDGSTAVFMSRAPLTGVPNTDAGSQEADAEVFRYSVSDGQLRCISCYENGVRPSGAEFHPTKSTFGYWYASRIPAWEFNMHAPRVMSANGDRVFFDSLNQLVPADRNSVEDVYEWEAAGIGTCTESSGDYKTSAGGCISLISSGEDERPSEFVDSSTDGRDVFFLTGQSLVPWDPGQIDLYDARELGGFPEPAGATPECQGEACQQPGAVPSTAGNSSESFAGPGNLKPKTSQCPKGKVKRHGKCGRKPAQKPKRHRKKHQKKKYHQGKKHQSGIAGHKHGSKGGKDR
jgi:hypothetical protein